MRTVATTKPQFSVERLMLVLMHMPMQMLMVWMVVVVAITKPQFRHCQAITKPTLAITKRLPRPLWQLPSHYEAPFGHYHATTKHPLATTKPLPSHPWPLPSN